jgi:3',5'-nucleoside bisphosphate phosphatase
MPRRRHSRPGSLARLPGIANDAPRFDLQSHSTYSDGSLPPAVLVAAAAAAGVELLALTDHDSVDGVDEAVAAADAIRGVEPGRRIRVVPAVEISARDREIRQDLHILGYLIDTSDRVLRALLDRSRSARVDRSAAMVTALSELGFATDVAILDARRHAGESIGRPHIAAAALAAPANAERLRREGITDPSSFLEAYLVPGAPAFRPRFSPSAGDAIDAIRAAGGVAVWAHPFWDVSDPDDVVREVDRLVAAGLGGVECFYPSHTRRQTVLLADVCAQRNLLSTGSADFHGPEHREFNRFRAFSTYGRGPELGRIAGA